MISSEKSFFQKVKYRLFIPVAIIILISTSLFYSFCKRSEKNDVIMQFVVQLAESEHFSPPSLDDQFSGKAFDAYLKKLDLAKQFLTKEDIKQMEVYKLQIDDQIRSNSFQLFDLAVRLMDKRVNETQNYYQEILSQPFDFTVNEIWEADPDKLDWPANSAELKDQWHKYLKYMVLSRVAEMQKQKQTTATPGLTDDQPQDKETDEVKGKTPEEQEAYARQKVKKIFDDIFQSLNQQKSEDKFSVYVNAIMAVFDPHTQYNKPSDKDAFDIRMSGQLEGIGATLQSSEGYVKVVDIVPGSPSWLQGELKVNDLITRVKQEHEQEPVDVYGMRIDDAVKLIRGKKGTKVTLTVKRADGSVRNITITRDVVIIEETYAKSAVVTDPATKTKVGYIYLPSFYVDFKHTATGSASSDDIAKEIEKLNKEGIQGIVLDLRNNTGGSLPDAIKMGGLFINSGPIVQVKSRLGPPRVYSDTDPNVQYDGPFVILVNSISASASEIVAAAMQDYKRAVIIGGPSTFGKGTVQVVADLDEYLSNNMSSLKPLGSLFLTIQKYYRINGGSTQLKGVTPDIILPDLFSELKFGERFEDYCLPWTTIDPAKYRVWKSPVPIETLQKKSKDRTSKSKAFQLLSEQVNVLKEQKDDSQVSLNMKTYQQEEEKRKQESKRFDEISKQPTSLAISALKDDIVSMKGDTTKIARSNKWLKDLNKDIYLEEAVKVIGDMK